MEKNRITNCYVGGTYQDTWTSDESTVRRNYYYNVWNGPFQNFGGNDKGLVPLENRTATWAYSAGILTLTIPSFFGTFPNPNIPVGSAIEIVNSSTTPTISQIAEVFEIGTNGDGTYYLKVHLSSNPFSTSPIYFFRYAQVKRLLFEENILDMAQMPSQYFNSAPTYGIFTKGRFTSNPTAGQNDPWTFKQVIVRGNIIRKKDGNPDPVYSGANTAIRIDSAENAIIEDNIIGQMQPAYTDEAKYLLRYSNCKTIKAFNNQNDAGKLRQLWNDSNLFGNNAGFYDDLANEAEDWLLGF
jgi:hypothetical protein